MFRASAEISLLSSYLKTAIRNLARHRIYSAINIIGIAIGLAFCILTYLFVHNEWTYDTFHENADRIYRVYIKHIKGRNERVHGVNTRSPRTRINRSIPRHANCSLRISHRKNWNRKSRFSGKFGFYRSQLLRHFFLSNPSRRSIPCPSRQILRTHNRKKLLKSISTTPTRLEKYFQLNTKMKFKIILSQAS